MFVREAFNGIHIYLRRRVREKSAATLGKEAGKILGGGRGCQGSLEKKPVSRKANHGVSGKMTALQGCPA